MDILYAFNIKNGFGKMISLTGGGGKTSVLFALAKALKAHHYSVLATTTTSVYYPQRDCCDNIFLTDEYEKLCEGVFRPGAGTVSVLGSLADGEGKLKGIAKEYADAIYKKNIFDTILVEADGSKRKPIKAPGLHEPVIPESSTAVIGVIGFDCFGKTIGPEWVHRPGLLAQIAGRDEGDSIDGEVIVKLALSPEGLFKNCPAKAQKIMLINKADTPEQRAYAKIIGNTVLKQSADIKRIVIGSVLGEEPNLTVIGNQ